MPKNKKRGVFILFDGADGVGKTTAAQAVAEVIGGVYYKNPPAVFDHFRSLVQIQDNTLESFSFYMEGNHEASAEIEALLAMGKHVVCDRSYPSTYAHHAAKNPAIAGIFNAEGLLKPDIYFLLVSAPEVRARRIAERKVRTSYDKPLENDAAYQQRVQDILRTAGVFASMNPVEIDTGTSSRPAIEAFIRARLKPYIPEIELT